MACWCEAAPNLVSAAVEQHPSQAVPAAPREQSGAPQNAWVAFMPLVLGSCVRMIGR